jgi:hypothetical protein
MDKLPVTCAALVKVKANEKNPFLKKWPNLVHEEKDLLSHHNSGGNLGIKTKFHPAFDIDIDDNPELCHEISTFIQERHSPWCVRKRSNSARFLIAFELKKGSEPFKKQVIPVDNGKIELLANGQQFVAWGNHDSGVPYETTIFEDSDPLTSEQCRDLFNDITLNFGINKQRSVIDLNTADIHTHADVVKTIIDWDKKGCRYDMLKKLAYMNNKEGVSDNYNINALQALMWSVPEDKRDDEWQLYMKENGRLERLVTDLSRLKKPTIPIPSNPLESTTPIFPGDTINEWPEPWPMIWAEWKKFPLDLNETLLFPTMLCAHAYLLRGNYLTEYGRRPNFFFLNLAPSTAGKDINSTDVIADIDDYMKLKGAINTPFTEMRSRGMNITADTSFLESIVDNQLFWIHTEASNIFRQLKNSANNSHVAALSDKMIEVVDGKMISGKAKAGKKINNIHDPNVQILFYAQPETIEDTIDIHMVDSGLFGRSIISILPEIDLNIDKFALFQRERKHKPALSDELRNFYIQKLNHPQQASKTRICIPEHEKEEMDKEWSKTKIAQLLISHKHDDSITKLLLRMGNLGEQIYTVICGVSQLWSILHDKFYDPIEIKKLIPILDYWVDCKMYAVKHLINSAIDPLSDIYLAAIASLLERGSFYRRHANPSQKEMLEEGYVSRAKLKHHLSKSKRLIRLCCKETHKGDISVRFDSIHRSLILNGIVVEKALNETPYVAILAS